MSNRQPGTIAKELIKGRAFLADKEHWCSNDYRSGFLWWRKFCAIGYIMYHMKGPDYYEARDLLDEAAADLTFLEDGIYGAIRYNDTFGHEGCLRLYDQGIQLALNRQL